jgi:hypothetical protein
MQGAVARYTKELQNRVEASRDGTPLQHSLWMLEEMGTWNLEDPIFWEKSNRWLGFVQGLLWMTGVYTIPQMADHNRSPVDNNRSPVDK